jgi:hypothetical protein
MSFPSEARQILITPQICVSVEQIPAIHPPQEPKPTQSDIPMVWVQDGLDFRLDITLPSPSRLEILFPSDVETLYINGEMIWGNAPEHTTVAESVQVEKLSAGLQLTCGTGGALHILATFVDKSEPKRNESRNGAN